MTTLQNNIFSKRMSGNFRYSLYIKNNTEAFQQFEDIIYNTWNGLKIYKFEIEEGYISLQLRDRDFVTEIYNMGHGVQMWLQIMWFIASNSSNSIIILDEPDVYMHADLQRKLIKILDERYIQAIIATHSIEIISEVSPDNILIIDRSKEESVFADNYPVLETAIMNIGSNQNINLSRILNNRKYIFVEGDDMEILSILYNKVNSKDYMSLNHIASTTTGGWGSWNTQKDVAKQLMSELNGLKVYFLYDRDYFPDRVIDDRLDDAKRNNICMHIWKRKEIENYLLNANTIYRFINKKKDGNFDEIE